MTMSRGAAEAFLRMPDHSRVKLLREMNEAEREEVVGLLAAALAEQKGTEEVLPLAA